MDKRRLLVSGALLFAVLIAYSNSLTGEFIFDDSGAVIGNPYISRIWPIQDAFKAPRRTTNSGRPIACFSLALNYQLAGYNVAGYRAFNIATHMACALLLFGLVRRSIKTIYPDENSHAALYIAAITTAFWALHPVNTVLVNYVAQRCELLSNFFILLTLYFSLRGFQSAERKTTWYVAAGFACVFGVGSKEVAVVTPILVLLFERAFFRRTFLTALRHSWPLYAGFLVAWLFGAWLVSAGGTAEGASSTQVKWGPWIYLLSQAESILTYLKLIFVPVSLCFDYGAPAASGLSAVWLAFFVVSILGILSFILNITQPVAGFCLAWFFLILAPSSSVIPLPDITVEYRMTLAMAGIIALCVGLGARFAANRIPTGALTGLVGLVCVLLLIGTFLRNRDYHSALAIWSDAAQKKPGNARAFANAGVALAQTGDLAGAEKVLRRAVAIEPDLPSVQMNFAAFLAMQGKVREALPYFIRAVEITPESAQAAFNLGNAYSDLGQSNLAVAVYQKAIALDPGFHDAYLNLGIELFGRREYAAALDSIQAANQIIPNHSNAHLMRGRVLLALNKKDAARQAFQTALQCDPKNRLAAQELQRLNP